jgi:hypothetical protein
LRESIFQEKRKVSTAVDVRAGEKSGCRSFDPGSSIPVWVEHAVHGTAVPRDETVAEPPSLTKQGLEEERARAACFSVDGVVRAHQALCFGLQDRCAELRSVVSCQILLGDVHIISETTVVAPGFDVVAGEMLHDTDELGYGWADTALHRGDVLIGVERSQEKGVLTTYGLLVRSQAIGQCVRTVLTAFPDLFPIRAL